MINRAELMGRLTHPPELRYTNQGTPYCRLRVATNRVIKGEQRTDFHDVVAWQALAEQCAKALAKGKVIHVEGRLETSSFEKDGEQQRRVRIVAVRINFLGRGHKGTGTPADGESFAPPAPDEMAAEVEE